MPVSLCTWYQSQQLYWFIFTNHFFEACCFDFSFLDQLLPIIRWVPTIQHFLKRSISICFTIVCSFSAFIIDPGINNHLAFQMISKKKAILLKEFYPKPMSVSITESCSLTVLWKSWILRYDFKSYFQNCRKTFCCILFFVIDGIFLAYGFNLFY